MYASMHRTRGLSLGFRVIHSFERSPMTCQCFCAETRLRTRRPANSHARYKYESLEDSDSTWTCSNFLRGHWQISIAMVVVERRDQVTRVLISCESLQCHASTKLNLNLKLETHLSEFNRQVLLELRSQIRRLHRQNVAQPNKDNEAERAKCTGIHCHSFTSK